MKKLAIGLGLVLVVLVGAVLVGPSLVDWNKYKGEIEARVEAATGRKLTIAGDINIAVLPAPAVIANDVSFANAEASESENMVELGSLEVRVALGPLFTGEVQVNKIVLVEPVVQLEIFADGGNNWTLDLGGAEGEADSTDDAAADATSTGGPAGGAIAGVTLDNFAIENGLITFRDGRTGALHLIEDINATLKAASLQGPFETSGSLKVMDTPVAFDIGVDGIFQGRTVPVSANVRAGPDAAELKISGNILNLFETPKFTGNVAIEAPSLDKVAMLAGAGPLPAVLAQSFSLSGPVDASAEAVTLGDAALAFGETSVALSLDAALGDVPQIGISLEVAHLDADELLAGGLTPAASQGSTAANGGFDAGTAETPSAGDPSPAQGVSIPDGIAVNLDVVVESIAYRAEKAGPLRASAGLANGEVTISQFTAQLPGAADVAMFGFLAAPDGQPSFDGEVEASVGDTRGLARWLGVDLSRVPSDRLRRLDFAATLKGNAENFQVAGIKAAFDRTNVNGGITLALRDRLSFGAAIAVDSIDLDPYLAGLATERAGSDVTQMAETGSGVAASSEAQSASAEAAGVTDALSALDVLKTFDANIRASAGKVIFGGEAIEAINVDATLFNGDLTLRDLSVGNAAGARLALKGAVGDLGGVPVLDGFSIDAASRNPAKIADMAGVELPVPASALGAVSLKADLDGNVLQPTIKGTVGAAGGSISVNGQASALPVKPFFDGGLRVSHPDLASLLKALDIGYTPSGPIGGADVSLKARVGLDTVVLSGINGKVNGAEIGGDASVALLGPRPVIEGTLRTGAISIDSFLPADSGSSAGQSSSGGGSSGSAGTAQPGYAQGIAPWPRDPIDLSGMGAVDATINLTAEQLSYGAVKLSSAVVVAKLVDSQLTVEQFTGIAFGGAVGFAGTVDGRSTPSANGRFGFKNANLSRLLSAVIGEPAALGALSIETSFDTRGASVADMVSALDGQGGFSMKGIDVQGATTGSALTGVLDLVRGFGQLGSKLSGGGTFDGLADAAGQFTISDGIASVSPLNIASAVGDGSASGTIDLAGWRIDMSGALDITGNLLTALIGGQAGAPSQVPFSVSGALDAPTVKMDTNLLSAVTPQVPGLDKLDEKVPGVGSLIQGVLGGGSQQQQSSGSGSGSTTSEPAPQPQPQQQTVKPEDIIKDLFNF